VAIVSRQEVVARGLTAMLADYPDRVTVVAIPSLRIHADSVDVILYDTLGLHNADGADLDHLLATGMKIMIFSRDMRPDLRARALARGCSAWVSMSIRPKELVEAIEAIVSDEPIAEQPDSLGAAAGLSQREVEILALITQGLSNQEISERLVLSENTLKSHIRNAYHKIGANSRSQAVAWAMQNGFAPPDL